MKLIQINESAIIARESDLTLNAKENIINSKLYGIDVATDMMNYTSDNFDETIKLYRTVVTMKLVLQKAGPIPSYSKQMVQACYLAKILKWN